MSTIEPRVLQTFSLRGKKAIVTGQHALAQNLVVFIFYNQRLTYVYLQVETEALV